MIMKKLKKLFEGIPNYYYQNNAKEIIYILPEMRGK